MGRDPTTRLGRVLNAYRIATEEVAVFTEGNLITTHCIADISQARMVELARMMPIYHALPGKFRWVTKNCLIRGNVKTQFISILSIGRSYTAKCLTGMVTAMCTTTISTLTLAGLLQDPLIQMVMRSDNVSQEDHSELLHRVKDSLVARSCMQDVALQPAL